MKSYKDLLTDRIASYAEYKQRVELLLELDKAYYIDANPCASDQEYDLLYKQCLEYEESNTDQILLHSPTQKIYDSLHEGFEKAHHAFPMLSLSNTYNKDELDVFFDRSETQTGIKPQEYCIELKMDGLAVSLRYENGVLVKAITRGNGEIGDDITQNIKTVRGIPHRIVSQEPPPSFEVRCEVYMPKKSFDRANLLRVKDEKEKWANPRNAAAGSLKLHDVKKVYERDLHAMCYSIHFEKENDIAFQEDVYGCLREFGFQTFSDDDICVSSSRDKILEHINKVEEKRHEYPFEIDGIVIKLNSFHFQSLLGATVKSPRWSVAYKYKPLSVETKILEILLQVGRSGVITPVAHFESVFVAGSLISKASLYNFDEIRRKDIRVHDTVLIEKGGDVIPKVTHVVLEKRSSDSVEYALPLICPSCSASLTKKDGIVALVCGNHLHCPAQNNRRFHYFVGKQGIDIESLGPKLCDKFIEHGFVTSFSDFFHITREQCLLLDGVKEPLAKKILQNIEDSKKRPFYKVIAGLGIPYIGVIAAKSIVATLDKPRDIFSLSKDSLLEIDGLGEKGAESMCLYITSEEGRNVLESFFNAGIEPTIDKIAKVENSAFLCKTYVITGTFENMSREEARLKIQQKGGKVVGSVSKKTSAVIFGASPGSKVEKAQNLGIECINEMEFIKMLENIESI